MPRDVILLLLGVPLGALASFLAWYVVSRKLVPELEFSPNLSKCHTKEFPSEWMYRFKVQNSGRRPAIDVELVAKLRLHGLRPGFPHNWETYVVPLEHNRVARMKPMNKRGLQETVRLKLEEPTWHVDLSRLVPEHTRKKLAEGTVTLEDLLKLTVEAQIRVTAFAYDEFSGARRVFLSPVYDLSTIKQGQFRLHSLAVDAEAEEQGLGA